MEQVLGEKYVVGQPLGEGGMARVFRGIMLAADSPVAIKIIRREFIEAHPEIFSEIAQERRDLTSISHTNLVKVIDFVSEDDTVGVIMDLVEGPSLRTYLRQNGQLPLGDALGFLTQILLGLSGLHSGGLVHGDIKPDNILLDDSRETPILKITDFGLLGVHRAAEPGQFFGTPAYVAPEVVRTGDVQEPADIYSAGIVFYEMLAGHPPFTADSSKDLFRLKETQPLPPIPMLTDEHATTFQKDVWSVLQVLLAKNPDNRPSAFLALALVELLEPTAQDRLWMLTHAVTGERSRGEAGDKQGSAHQEPRHSVSFTSEGPVGDYVSLSIPSIRIPVSPAPPDFQNESVWSEPVFNTVTVIPPSAWPPPPPSPPPPPPPQEPVSNLDHFIPANPLAEEDIVHSSGAVRRFDCGPREFLIVDRLDGKDTLNWTTVITPSAFTDLVSHYLADETSEARVCISVNGVIDEVGAELGLSLAKMAGESLDRNCDFVRVDNDTLSIAYQVLPGAQGHPPTAMLGISAAKLAIEFVLPLIIRTGTDELVLHALGIRPDTLPARLAAIMSSETAKLPRLKEITQGEKKSEVL